MIFSKKKMPILIISIIALLAGLYLLFFQVLRNNSDYKKIDLEINGQKIQTEIVKSSLAQARGLSVKDEISSDYGMLFVFSTSTMRNFWMKDMKFPIDIIWINGREVIGLAENALPQPGAKNWELKLYSSPARADKVLEMKAGSVQRLGIIPGTEIGGL